MTSDTPSDTEAGPPLDHSHTPQTLRYSGYTIQLHNEKNVSFPARIQDDQRFLSSISPDCFQPTFDRCNMNARVHVQTDS